MNETKVVVDNHLPMKQDIKAVMAYAAVFITACLILFGGLVAFGAILSSRGF